MGSVTNKLKSQKSEVSILVGEIKEGAKTFWGGTSHQVHGHVETLKARLSSTGRAGRKVLAETLSTTLPQDLKQRIKKKWSQRFSSSHGARAGAGQGLAGVPQKIVHTLQRFKTKRGGENPGGGYKRGYLDQLNRRFRTQRGGENPGGGYKKGYLDQLNRPQPREMKTVAEHLRAIRLGVREKPPLITESKSRPMLKAAADGTRGDVIHR